MSKSCFFRFKCWLFKVQFVKILIFCFLCQSFSVFNLKNYQNFGLKVKICSNFDIWFFGPNFFSFQVKKLSKFWFWGRNLSKCWDYVKNCPNFVVLRSKLVQILKFGFSDHFFSVFKFKNCQNFGFKFKICQNVRIRPKCVQNLVVQVKILQFIVPKMMSTVTLSKNSKKKPTHNQQEPGHQVRLMDWIVKTQIDGDSQLSRYELLRNLLSICFSLIFFYGNTIQRFWQQKASQKPSVLIESVTGQRGLLLDTHQSILLLTWLVPPGHTHTRHITLQPVHCKLNMEH